MKMRLTLPTFGAVPLVVGTIAAATWGGNEVFNKPIEEAKQQEQRVDLILDERQAERNQEIATWLKEGKGHQWLTASGINVGSLNELVDNDGKPGGLLLEDLSQNQLYLSEMLDAGIVPYVFYESLDKLEQRLQKNPGALIKYFSNEIFPHRKEGQKLFENVLITCGKSVDDLPELCKTGLFKGLLASAKEQGLAPSKMKKLLVVELNECRKIVDSSVPAETYPATNTAGKLAALHAAPKK